MTYNNDIKEATMVADNIEETLLDAEENIAENDNAKKKFPLQKTIIIAACILIAAVIGYFAIFISTPTIEGTWLYETEDGLKLYYTIEKVDKKYTLDASAGTMGWRGICELGRNEKNRLIDINLYREGTLIEGSPYGIYTYDVSGNRFSKDAVLTLTDEEGKSIKLNKATKPQMIDYMQPYENYKTKQELLGTWVQTNIFGQTYKATFNSDGTFCVDFSDGVQYEQYYYTIEDSVVIMKIFADEVIEQQLDFYMTEDGLVLNNQLWTKAVN